MSYGTEVVPDSTSGTLIINSNAMSYCLRAYSSGTQDIVNEASNVFARLVTQPFLNEFVTQGRLDGKGKRGSCEGFQNVLECILNFIKDDCRSILEIVKSMNQTMKQDNRLEIHLLMIGIWEPISKYLNDRLGHQLFSLSNVDLFHSNYLC